MAVLDGESVPFGGMGVSRQIKDEYPNPVPTVVLVARMADAWLATWSNAEAIASYPLDPLTLPKTVADVIRDNRDAELNPEPLPQPGVSSVHKTPADVEQEQTIGHP